MGMGMGGMGGMMGGMGGMMGGGGGGQKATIYQEQQMMEQRVYQQAPRMLNLHQSVSYNSGLCRVFAV